jgi:hypothetical protein
VVAFVPEVGEAFLRLAVDCGLYVGVDFAKVSWSRPRESIIYWKTDALPWTATLEMPERRGEGWMRSDFESGNGGGATSMTSTDRLWVALIRDRESPRRMTV